MGNTTNPDRWDARQRLEFIETAAWWRGLIRRSDLVNEFGISLPQASADLQAYLETNPGSLDYDLRAKTYVAAASMVPRLTHPVLRDAVRRLIPDRASTAAEPSIVGYIDLPYRSEPAETTKHLFRAVWQKKAIEVRYVSLNGGTETWRWISPHAFAHDGYRWHVRALCHRDQRFKDFVIGRMPEVREPVASSEITGPDHEWNTMVKIRLRPHRKLTDIQQRAIKLDFEMRQGLVTLEVRKSMLNYTLAYLGLRGAGEFPKLLELADD